MKSIYQLGYVIQTDDAKINRAVYNTIVEFQLDKANVVVTDKRICVPPKHFNQLKRKSNIASAVISNCRCEFTHYLIQSNRSK